MMKRNQERGLAINGLLLGAIMSFCFSCQFEGKKLPIYGERDWTKKTVDGKEVVDTIYHTIPDFKFVNQYGDTVNQALVKDKIYVADFFFTTCPTICPVMKKEMKEVFKEFKGNSDVLILSHSIDPDHDTVALLHQYAQDLGVLNPQWQFLTGEKEKIYEIGQKSYMVPTKEDSTAEGGYLHSGAFILIDKARHVRGMYDGTTEEGRKKLIADMHVLLDEYKN